MNATDRLHTELVFHDEQADGRAVTFDNRPDGLVFLDDAYLDHETWVRPAFGRLGDLAGRRALDYGCGHAMAAVVLARSGARVTAFDLSYGYIAEAKRRASANGVAIDFVQADGHRLPFADHTFDAVWGHAILHHLDLPVAGRELRRVLRPGGVAVFCEPWGENPLLDFARRRLPYASKHRTPDEQPLRRRHVRALECIFPRVEVQGHQFLAMVRRVLPAGRLVRLLDRCDEAILRRAPGFRRWCRYVVLTLRS